jgi:hypothetical protein
MKQQKKNIEDSTKQVKTITSSGNCTSFPPPVTQMLYSFMCSKKIDYKVNEIQWNHGSVIKSCFMPLTLWDTIFLHKTRFGYYETEMWLVWT